MASKTATSIKSFRSEPVIRPVRLEDAPALYRAVQHPDVAKMILLQPSIELPMTEAHVKNRVPGHHYLVAEVDGQAVGSIGVTQSQNPRMAHSGILGLMVHRDYWGQGIGGRLMAAILDIADNWLNLKRVELGVLHDNPAANHLYQKFGFVEEGVRRFAVYGGGRWADEIVMARLRDVDGLKVGQPAAPAARDPRRYLQEDQFLIRPPHPHDSEDVYQIWGHPSVSRTTLQIPSQEITKTLERMNSRPPGLHRLVAETENRVIGVINLFQDQNPSKMHRASLGMAVHPDSWGRGVGQALMAAILDLADNWLNLKRVELDVYTDNPPAIRLYKKFGFEIEGTHRFHSYGDGRWTDSYFMARLRERG